MRRRLLIVCFIVFAGVGFTGTAWADNPHSSGQTGPPNQSCQALEPHTPGHAATSPGSPFNEPGINSQNGGTGGQHYSPKSQYDVGCFQQSQH